MKYNILRGPQVNDAKTPLLNNLHWQLKAINHVRILILQLPFYINYNLTKKKTYKNNLIQRIAYITLFIYIIFPFSIFSHPFQNDSCCNQHENVSVSKK